MSDWFLSQEAVVQAMLAGLFTWLITMVGAATVFTARGVHQKLLDAMLGFSGGVMLAASYWSLLAPAIAIAEEGALPEWLPPAVGFLLGGAVLWVMDKTLPHLHPGLPVDQAEGPSTEWRRAVLLVTAITLHNIPEGIAVGVAFGGADLAITSGGVGGAVALALGIAMQNFPEGIAVAMPLRADGMGRLQSFGYGQLSALVEPVAAVLGAAAVVHMEAVLPYALSFAAGAMVYVVVEELIPESHQAGNEDLATVSLLVGFVVMMVLDVALG